MLLQLLLFTSWNGDIPQDQEKFPIAVAFRFTSAGIKHAGLLNLPVARDERLEVTNLLRKDLNKNRSIAEIAQQFY